MEILKPRERSFWNDYLAALPSKSRPKNPFVYAGYAGGRKNTDALIRLYRAGKKTAGSGLVKDYETAGDPLPKPGNFWILLDSAGRPQFLLRTLRTEINLFGRIPKSVAMAEGEGDRSVVYWKKVHGRFFSPFLKDWGVDDIAKAEVITEHFEIVHRATVSGNS